MANPELCPSTLIQCPLWRSRPEQKQVRQENHSWAKWAMRPGNPGPFVEARTQELLERDGAEADRAAASVWR